MAHRFLILLSLWMGALCGGEVVTLFEYPYNLHLDDYVYQNNGAGLSYWQILDHLLKERTGNRLVSNVFHYKVVKNLSRPSLGGVIFNNIPGNSCLKVVPGLSAKKILICWEPPVVIPRMYSEKVFRLFDAVLTWDKNLVNPDKRIFKFCYPCLMPVAEKLRPFSQRRLLTQISRDRHSSHPKELYSKRREVLEYFERHPEKDFTFFGMGWDGAKYRKYGGEVKDKLATLQKFRFSICFENTRDINGYVTEKIFDCFAAGCIPVYWGAPDITDYIPQGCFIPWQKFRSTAKLYDYLKKMPEAEYQRYLTNIRTFVSSSQAQQFSHQTLAHTILKALKAADKKKKEKSVSK